jgi:DNA end-binding protein Ku
MYSANEMRAVEGYGKLDHEIRLRPQELKLAHQLVESLAEDFDPKKYHDTYKENLKALLEAKQKGKTVVEEAPAKRAPVIDMMEGLKRSVRETEMHRQEKRPTRARPAASQRAKRGAA